MQSKSRLGINRVYSCLSALFRQHTYCFRHINESYDGNKSLNIAGGLLFIGTLALISAAVVSALYLQALALAVYLLDVSTLDMVFPYVYFFSWARIYYFALLFFVLYVAMALGKQNALRYRHILILGLFVMLVAGQFTGSSIGMYDYLLKDKTEAYENPNIVGFGQPVRSDEWAVEKPMYFAQAMSEDEFPYYNRNLAFDGMDMAVAAFAPVRDIIILARPDLLGFLFLPPEYAFSYYWWSRIMLLFVACFELLLILTKRYRYALLGSIIIMYAPPVQWWLSQTMMLMIMSGSGALVCFYYWLHSSRWTSRLLCLLGMGWSALIYLLTMYPAVQVPLAYVFLTLFAYLCIDNWSQKPFSVKNLLCYILALLPFSMIALRFFLKSAPALNTLMNTVYPGSKREWYALPWDYCLYSIVNVFTSVRPPLFLNSCEISQFWSFIPFSIIIIAFIAYKKFHLFKLQLMLGGISLLLFGLAVFPPFEMFNRFSGLDYSYPTRIMFASGFGFTLLLLTLLPVLEDEKMGMRRVASILWAVLIGAVLLWFTLDSPNVAGYFPGGGLGYFIIVSGLAVYSFMGYLLLKGGRKSVRAFSIMLLLVTLGSTILINPVIHGTDAIFEKAAMAKVRELNGTDSGRWMVSGAWPVANLLSAQGVARVSGTYYYPDLKMMETLDPDRINFNNYNCFANIDMRLSEKGIVFSNYDFEKGEELFVTERIIYVPIETVKKLGVKYIFTCIDLPSSILDSGQVELLYEGSEDKWRIYKLN